jgi:HEAT repeat protein
MRPLAAVSGVTLGLLLVAAGTAAADAPLTAAPAGDGIDVRDGARTVAHVPLKTPALRRGPARLRTLSVDGHRVAELRVPVLGKAAEEVWIAELPSRGAPKAIWSGLTGARDADEESAVAVEVTDDRVLEYQTAPNITRCDGVPPRLFPRAYDFDAGRFRSVMSALPEPGAEKLVARRGDPAMPAGKPIGGFHWTAASTTRGAGTDARALTAPSELDDGQPGTAWAEGLGGDGRGEFLTARSIASGAPGAPGASGAYAVSGLRILPGDGASAEAFRAHNRVRRFQLALGPAREQRYDVEIPQDAASDAAHWRDPYWVALPKPVPSACVTVIITEVAHGSEASPPKSYGTTAIGELAIFTDVDGPNGAERLIADLAKTPDCAARLPMIVDLGAPAVLPLAQAVTTATGSARECLVDGLVKLEPAPQNPIVVDALAGAVVGATEREERLIAGALSRAALPPIAPLGKLLGDPRANLDDRARAARVLGALPDPRAADALLDAVGTGPAALRGEVLEALANAPGLRADAVLARLAAPPAAGAATEREGDLLRVLPAAVKRAPERMADALAKLRGALAPERGFAVQARAVLALGALGSAGDPEALASVRGSSGDPVLRYLAARELGDLGGGPFDARPALRAALSDADPRVRETAAVGLGRAHDAGAGGALIVAAKQEPWPFVRRAEVEALGQLCGAAAGDLLVRAVERDVDDVRRAGLVGLARCKDPHARTLLLRTLARHDETAPLRALAAALLGDSGDRTVAPLLAEALHRLVNQSEGDMALEGPAAATLRALARLGGPEATQAAVALAGDKRHPYRETAVEALGVLCDPGAGRATLRTLASDKDGGGLAVAAQAAERRCGFTTP